MVDMIKELGIIKKIVALDMSSPLLKYTLAAIGTVLLAGCQGLFSQELDNGAFVTGTETPTIVITVENLPMALLTGTPIIKFTPTGTYNPSITPRPSQTPTLTTTPTPLPDTTGPDVSNITVSVIRVGSATFEATISARVFDHSGVATVTIYYYKVNRGSNYRSAGQMRLSQSGIYILITPTFHSSQYDFRILAVDNLGNANCTVTNLAACPGQVVWSANQ
ncbi:MAG: hypothetical protein IH859_09685 [Chloroflexi bacterium]|nr:hypothetical protein [Chloroflexota bacterium]